MDMDLLFMKEALKEAAIAYEKGEVPVGAVMVHNGEIISRAHNTRETEFSAIAHAEVTAIREACRVLHGWRLEECTLYVTLEPCPMCAGAIINARIPRVVFGAWDASMGAMGSVLQMTKYPLPSKPCIVSGVLESECGALLSDFFEKRRGK
jgi:tRNA(adenine34) deaminase